MFCGRKRERKKMSETEREGGREGENDDGKLMRGDGNFGKVGESIESGRNN